MCSWPVIFAIFGLLSGARAVGNTLVLLDNLVIRETHSIFFKALQERGYTLSFRSADDSNLVLSKYGEYLYKNLIIFAPSVEEFGGSLNVDAITDFIDNGGNVLATGSGDSGDALRELASECGMELDEPGSLVIDHLNFDEKLDDGRHTMLVIPAENLADSEVIVGKGTRKGTPLLYRGAGILADPENPLIIPVLHADSSAYTHQIDSTSGGSGPRAPATVQEYPHAVGRGAVLVAALQARNNARVVFSGSLELFSDEMSLAVTSTGAPVSNGALAEALAKWTFGESGQLKVKGVGHHLVKSVTGTQETNETQPNPDFYTVGDTVLYWIELDYMAPSGKYEPYITNDLQLEFTRIDPFIRTTLKYNSKTRRYETLLKIPDVYGVYKFKINYAKLGYTTIINSVQVSVRPLKHTEYERFIDAAMPYYAGAISMMVGVWIFSFIFLHYKEETPAKLHKKVE